MNPFMEAFQTQEIRDLLKKMDQVIINARKMANKPLRQILPKLKYSYIVLPGNIRVNSGDTLFRPIIGESTLMSIEHAAIVYGTSEDDKRLILEMNDDDNVCCVDFNEFLRKHDSNNIRIRKKPEEVLFDDMLNRAEEFQYSTYSAYDCNCQIFANYCTFGLKVSPGAENLKQLTIPMIFLVSKYLEATSFNLDSKSKKSVLKTIDKLNTLKQILEKNA